MCFDIGIVTCGPNEALIISGVCYGNEPNTIVGGRAIVCPCLQTVQRISLGIMTLIIQSPNVVSSQGVPISVTGVAQVKINGSSDEMLRAAAEQFGGKDTDEIMHSEFIHFEMCLVMKQFRGMLYVSAENRNIRKRVFSTEFLSSCRAVSF